METETYTEYYYGGWASVCNSSVLQLNNYVPCDKHVEFQPLFLTQIDDISYSYHDFDIHSRSI